MILIPPAKAHVIEEAESPACERLPTKDLCIFRGEVETVIIPTGSRNRVALFMRFRVHMALAPVTADKTRGGRNVESGVLSVMAFYEKAGPRQVDFDLSFSKILPFLHGGRCSERPGAVKGAFFAAERTLDGEDRSATIPPGRKGSGRCGIFGLSSVLPSRPNQPCRHPSIRTLR